MMKMMTTLRKAMPAPAFLLAMLLVFGAYLFSCEETLENEQEGPATFKVEIVDGDRGSEDNPVYFSLDATAYTLNVEALDEDGEIDTSVDREVTIRLAPNGELRMHDNESLYDGASGRIRVKLKNGEAGGVVVYASKLHGKNYFWIEDEGTKWDADENFFLARGSFATGLSEPIYAANPTIRNIQEPEGAKVTPIKGNFVDIRVDQDNPLIVTGVTHDGFYVTDPAEPENIYNGLFVFSFSRPSGVEVGFTITQLSGQVDVYYGFTELSFPSWKVIQKAVDKLPSAVSLDATKVDDNAFMGQYESRLVGIEDVEGATICPLTEDYETYGQWEIALRGGKCPDEDGRGESGTIKMVTTFADPNLGPEEFIEEYPLIGNLRYHLGAGWMIYAVNAEDFGWTGDPLDDESY